MTGPLYEVPMDIYTRTLAPRFTKLLAKRESELRTILRPTGDYAAPTPEAKADHALEELEQVVAARKRLAEQSYGECLDCGEPIDLRRLMAMPATPYCTGCQDIHEHGRAVGARRATLHLIKGKNS
jgi:DnaK suppressor protein